jgi:type VI secretion system FHA domain protein
MASPFGGSGPGGGGDDIWGAAPAAPAPLGGGFDPRPRQAPAQGDFADQHIEMPQFAPPPPQPRPMPQPAAAPPYAPPPYTAPQAEAFQGTQFSQPPQPQPTYPPVRAPAASPTPAADSAILRAIAEGAGVPETLLTQGDPIETAREIGRALRVATDELAGLLRARAATKQSVRSGSRTMLGAADNNPLKFIPTAPERLDAMFGTGKPGFQRGAESVRKSFEDVKRHQYAVHAAIQPALARLIEDLSPESVEQKVGSSLLHSRKARAWEIFVERWDAKTHPYENGMLDLFMKYFAEAYDAVEQGGTGSKS